MRLSERQTRAGFLTAKTFSEYLKNAHSVGSIWKSKLGAIWKSKLTKSSNSDYVVPTGRHWGP